MPASSQKNIELLPKEDWEKTSFGRFLHWTLSVGRYIVIATELAVILAFLARFKLDRDLTNLHEEIGQKQAVVEASTDFENEFRFLQKKLATVAEIETRHAASAELVGNLNALIPLDVSLTELSAEGNEISISALALSEDGFASFLDNLEASELFAKPKVKSVISDTKTGTGIEFELESQYLTKEN